MYRRGVAVIAPGGWTRQGGLEGHARAVVRHLRAADPGRTALLIDSRGEGGPATWPGRLALAAARLTRARAAGLVDVAHLQVSERSSFARKGALQEVARGLGIRCVLHHHGAEVIPVYERAPGPARAAMRRVVRRAHVNVVLGHLWRDWLVDEMGVAPERAVVLHNGVADLAAPPAPPERAGPFRPLLLAVLSERKGVHVHIEALSRLRARGVEFRATIAGGGPDLERFRALAAERGVAEWCDFPGWVAPERVPEVLGRHDAYVLPSLGEGLPLGILEAMRSARPVIATDVGAVAEAFPPGRGVAIVPPGDVGALAGAMAALAADPGLARERGLAARALYAERFSFASHVARLLALYRGDEPLPSAAEGRA